MKQSIIVKILDGDDIRKQVIFNTDDYQRIDNLVRVYCPNFKKIIDWKLERVLVFDINEKISLSDMEEKLRPLEDGFFNDVKDIENKIKHLLGFEQCTIVPDSTSEVYFNGLITYCGRHYSFSLKYGKIDEKIRVRKVSVVSSIQI